MGRLRVRFLIFILACIGYFWLLYYIGEMTGAVLFITLSAGLLMGMEMVRRVGDTTFSKKSQFKETDEIGEIEFVQFVASLFKRLGYYVKVIPSKEYKGADLVIFKNKQKLCIKCGIDQYNTNSLVEEVSKSLNTYGSHRGIVVSKWRIDEEEQNYAKQHGVQLIDYEALQRRIQQAINNCIIAD